MKLSLPVYRLKREAKVLARKENIPLHAALDRIALAQGFPRWSLLAAKLSEANPAQALYAGLSPGDLVLVAARPGHGKTLMSLEIAVEAMRSGRPCAFFSLEYTERDIIDRFRAIDVEPARYDGLFTFDGSDCINASHIISTLEDFPPGAMAVVDYLQLLDQKRDNPDLQSQVRNLKTFARERCLTIIFIAQIARSFDPAKKTVPDLGDVRLPNPLDLSLFDKSCFLNNGELRLVAGSP
jgi:hypothetical protein